MQWSTEELRSLVWKLVEITREKILNLVQNAYSSININELASLLSLTPENTVSIVLKHEWSLNETNQFIFPKQESKFYRTIIESWAL
jgi:hypothetical protein